MNEYLLLHYATEHYEQRVKAAERGHRMSPLFPAGPGRAQGVLSRLGDLLVHAGQRLQRDYAPEMGRA